MTGCVAFIRWMVQACHLNGLEIIEPALLVLICWGILHVVHKSRHQVGPFTTRHHLGVPFEPFFTKPCRFKQHWVLLLILCVLNCLIEELNPLSLGHRQLALLIEFLEWGARENRHVCIVIRKGRWRDGHLGYLEFYLLQVNVLLIIQSEPFSLGRRPPEFCQ